MQDIFKHYAVLYGSPTSQLSRQVCGEGVLRFAADFAITPDLCSLPDFKVCYLLRVSVLACVFHGPMLEELVRLKVC